MTNQLSNRQVQEYLRTLDRALTKLPADQASELREQIVSHLDEAISPDMNDDAVWAVLRDLGRPSDLISEAGSSQPAPVAPTATAKPRRRRLIAVIAAAVLVVLAVGAAVADHLYSQWSGRNAADLSTGSFAWYLPADAAAQTTTEADGHAQVTIPIRPDTVQGFYFDLFNDSTFTQTVKGLASPVFGSGTYHLSFSLDLLPTDGFMPTDVTVTGSVDIPPHHQRIVLVTWPTSTLPCHGPGTGSVQDQLRLAVHVGWFDRTETIPLYPAVGLRGPGGHCS